MKIIKTEIKNVLILSFRRMEGKLVKALQTKGVI